MHSKVYVWSTGNEFQVAFCSSANYSMHAFQKRRECMSNCDPLQARDYYDDLHRDTVDCFDTDVESKMRFSEADTSSNEDVSEDNLENLSYEKYVAMTPIDQVSISLLTRRGDVGHGSGIN